MPAVLIPFETEDQMRYWLQECLADGRLDNFNGLQFLGVKLDFEV